MEQLLAGTISVLVADRQPLFTGAVRRALEREPDLRIVSEARTGIGAIEQAARFRPDVLLIDSACAGDRVIRRLRECLGPARIIVLSDDEDGEALERAIEAGATGFVCKSAGLRELVETTRAVHRGESRVPGPMLGDLLRRLIEARSERLEAQGRLGRLGPRERAVLDLLCAGATNQRIAETLTISTKTARTHVQNIFRKLGVHSRLEAAAVARVAGGHGSEDPDLDAVT